MAPDESHGGVVSPVGERAAQGSLAHRLRYVIFFVVAVVVIALLTHRESGPKLGIQAADFDLPLVSAPGRQFHLAAERGTPVLIDVFASWCPSCRRTAPILERAFHAERARRVSFVGVSVDRSMAEARGAKRAWDIGYPVAFDATGSFAKRYDIAVLPTLILIDAKGRVRHVSSGTPSSSQVESWLSDVGAARR